MDSEQLFSGNRSHNWDATLIAFAGCGKLHGWAKMLTFWWCEWIRRHGMGIGGLGVRLALNRDGCAIGSNCRGRHIWPAMQPGLNLPHSRIQMSISVVTVVSGPFPFTIPIQLQAPGKPSSNWRSGNAKDGPHPDLVPWPATRQGVRKNKTYKICL